MKKKIKLYLHHEHFESITYTKRLGFFSAIFRYIFRLFEMIGNFLIMISYGIGLGVIQLFLLPKTLLLRLTRLPRTIKSAMGKLHSQTFRKTIVRFGLVAIVLTVGIQSLSIVATGQELKGEVLGSSDVGLGYLEDAKTSLESENIAAAQANFNRALEQFKISQETLNSTSKVLQGLLLVVPEKHDADNLLLAAQKITEAAIKATELLNMTADIKLSAVGLNEGEKNKETLIRAQTLINESVDSANEAARLVNSVSISSIPENYHASFIVAKDAANFFQTNVSSLKEVCSLMFDLLLGAKNTLIVFTNNNELRANGGFMGTLGNAKMANGSLNSLDIRTVYDWDGQLTEKILPPQPMYLVNNRWFLRDSNWFANFPDSAGRISSFFEKEGGETPDLIVLMTPEVIIDMLERTGPINLPQHNITLTKDNFIEETQTATSVNYDKQLNQPKQFLADFFPLLMERLGSSGNGGVMGFLEIFQQNLFKKQIVLYSRDQKIQTKISAFNWGGEVRSTDRDYLSIINSNLGGTKTDRSLQRIADLSSVVNPDGSLTNTLRYTVRNPLPNSPGLSNKSFIRIYVPKGSVLNNTEGFNQEISLPQIPLDDYILDETVMSWQKTVKQDTVSGTFIGEESSKTWFGNWLEVEGGQTKTVTLTYTLPFKLGNTDRYSLLIQKQVGSQNDEFNFQLDFTGRRSLWKTSSLNLENSTIKYSQSLIADSFFGTVLQK